MMAVLLCILKTGHTQEVVFEPFVGQVYKLPNDKKKSGFGPYVKDLEPFTEIVLDSLNIPWTKQDTPLLHVPMRPGTAFLFKSAISFPKTGKYRFQVLTDDGCRIWINDSLVVLNDGRYHIRPRVIVKHFEAGTYPMRMWYYQGFPDKYQLELKVSYQEDKMAAKELSLVLSDEDLTFEFNSFTLTPAGREKIENLITELKGRPIKNIDVHGHTDSVGEAAYNKDLSLKRAQAVRDVINEGLGIEKSNFSLKGFGEEKPVADNRSSEGRKANRRVEIRIEFL